MSALSAWEDRKLNAYHASQYGPDHGVGDLVELEDGTEGFIVKMWTVEQCDGGNVWDQWKITVQAPAVFGLGWAVDPDPVTEDYEEVLGYGFG